MLVINLGKSSLNAERQTEKLEYCLSMFILEWIREGFTYDN